MQPFKNRSSLNDFFTIKLLSHGAGESEGFAVGMNNSGTESQADGSAVGQTANIGRSTSVTSGAAKVFREFKWGLLTLFLLMVVVIGLVYDGGRTRKAGQTDAAKVAEAPPPEINLDAGVEAMLPPTSPDIVPVAPPVPPASNLNQPLPPGTPIVETTQPPTIAPAPVAPPVVETPHLTVKPPVANEPAPVEKPAGNHKTYVVKSGDTLTRIANTMLPGKGNLKALTEANKDVLPDPHKLKVGMTLKIPAALPAPEAKAPAPKTEVAEKVAPGAKAEAVQLPDSGNEYVVQGGDTLERIARKLFNDGRKWRDLFEWNRDQLSDPGRLRQGQVLRIKQSGNQSGNHGSARADSERKADTPKTAALEEKKPAVASAKDHAAPEEVEVMSRPIPVDLP